MSSLARKIARGRGKRPAPRNGAKPMLNGERLVSAAIIRNGDCAGGFRSHAEIRANLGDECPYDSKPGDQEGFLTSKGRFVDRSEAMRVGDAAGQCAASLRPLLSSDIRW